MRHMIAGTKLLRRTKHELWQRVFAVLVRGRYMAAAKARATVLMDKLQSLTAAAAVT